MSGVLAHGEIAQQRLHWLAGVRGFELANSRDAAGIGPTMAAVSADPKMIGQRPKEPQDCSLSARLPRATERVWWRKERHCGCPDGRSKHTNPTSGRCARGWTAEACAEAGNIERTIEIVVEAEQLIYETNAFPNAASMISTISNN